MYNFLPKNRLNWLEPQHPGLVLVERSEDLLCAHTFIHCLLFAVNGGWTAERVPEDAELVAAGSSSRESLKCQLLWWRGNRRWRTALACDGRVISEQRCCHDFKQLSLLFSLGIPLCFKRVVRTSRHTHTHTLFPVKKFVVAAVFLLRQACWKTFCMRALCNQRNSSWTRQSPVSHLRLRTHPALSMKHNLKSPLIHSLSASLYATTMHYCTLCCIRDY